MQLVRGPAGLLQKFCDLKIRSEIVIKLAEIYIDRKVQDLKERPGVLDIHTFERCATVAESLKTHARRRVNSLYPSPEGILPGLAEIIKEREDREKKN